MNREEPSPLEKEYLKNKQRKQKLIANILDNEELKAFPLIYKVTICLLTNPVQHSTGSST